MPYMKNSTFNEYECRFASALRKTQFLNVKQEQNVDSDRSQ